MLGLRGHLHPGPILMWLAPYRLFAFNRSPLLCSSFCDAGLCARHWSSTPPAWSAPLGCCPGTDGEEQSHELSVMASLSFPLSARLHDGSGHAGDQDSCGAKEDPSVPIVRSPTCNLAW